MAKIIEQLFLFFFGGIAYLIIELLWRGYSHMSMFVLGGMCFAVIGLINEKYTFDMPFVAQMIIGTFAITALEFIFGCILNIYLKLNVWDYSNMPMNIMGQICVPYMLLWFVLSPIAIIADDYLRYAIFDDEKPHYRIF